MCYQLGGASVYKQVGSAILAVTEAVPPLSYTPSTEPGAVLNTEQTFSFSSGMKLQLGPGKDSVKAVLATGDCISAPAGGSSEVTNLGPDDGSSATTAEVGMTFSSEGEYRLCYRVYGGTYELVGEAFLVRKPPGSFSGSAYTGGASTIRLVGGYGMNLLSGNDALKVVAASGDCTGQAVGGSSVVTDLGPDDTSGSAVDEATASLTFDTEGAYKVCYQLVGSSYVQVGSNLT